MSLNTKSLQSFPDITPDMDQGVISIRNRPRSYTIRHYNGENVEDFTSGSNTDELTDDDCSESVDIHNSQSTLLTTLDSAVNDMDTILKQRRSIKRERSMFISSVSAEFSPAAAYICIKLLDNWIDMHRDRDEFIVDLEKQREGLISTIEQLKDSACNANTELNKIRTSNKKARHE